VKEKDLNLSEDVILNGKLASVASVAYQLEVTLFSLACPLDISTNNRRFSPDTNA
jgi:hypothetical protein